MNQKVFNVLNKLEIHIEGQPSFWNVSHDTGNLLNILTRTVDARCVLEIGTSNGYSGIWFAEALSHSGGKLYTVESHLERFDLARKNFDEAGVSHIVEQLFGHAPEIFLTDDFQQRKLVFDLIFLDATKMEYIAYFQAVAALLRTGGILIADNIFSHNKELASFLTFVDNQSNFRAVTIPMGSGLLLAYKESN